MNREIVIGNWRQIKGAAMQQWGRITDDGFLVLEGRHEKWAGEVMEAKGIARADTERRLRHAVR